MKALLILNPGSRGGRSRPLWESWTAGLAREGVPFEAAPTTDIHHARSLARTAHGFDTVVAVGGDGTINAVLTGLLESGLPPLRLGVLYAGTSPDFCRFHGIPVEPKAALATLLAGHTARVDIARIRYRTAQGPATACFGCSCNIGMGAAVAGRSNRLRPFVGDVAGTALATLWTLVTSRPVNLEVEIDGQPFPLPRTNHLVVLKNPFLASGLRLRLDRTPDDGRLTVLAVTGRGRLGLLRLLPAFYSGDAVGAKGVFVREGRSVSVRTADACAIEFDGDPRGTLPVQIEVDPGALPLITSSHARI